MIDDAITSYSSDKITYDKPFDVDKSIDTVNHAAARHAHPCKECRRQCVEDDHSNWVSVCPRSNARARDLEHTLAEGDGALFKHGVLIPRRPVRVHHALVLYGVCHMYVRDCCCCCCCNVMMKNNKNKNKKSKTVLVYAILSACSTMHTMQQYLVSTPANDTGTRPPINAAPCAKQQQQQHAQ